MRKLFPLLSALVLTAAAVDQAEPPPELKDSFTAMQASFGKMADIMKKADPIQKMKGGM